MAEERNWPAERLAAAKAARLGRAQDRKTRIMAAALEEARTRGWDKMTREAVASRASVSVGGVSNAFGRMDQLRNAVMQEAVDQDIPEIVARGLAAGNETARNAPPALKARALATLT